nr:GFA family protein [Acidihalobacter prosperus]
MELEIAAEPMAQFFCHCDDCQAAHGAAYVPESVYRADEVRILKGEPASWALERNPRFFCQDCGTRLFIEVTALGLRGVNGYLLPVGAFRPRYHMQCRFALQPVRDGLPHYRAIAPQFGGPDVCVDW